MTSRTLARLALALTLTLVLAVASFSEGAVAARTAPRGFVHITDIHLDDYYTSGSDEKSSSCHRGSGHAGPFGTRGRCDAPKTLVTSAFHFLERLVLRIDGFEDAPVVDFVLWTGDNARHDHDKKIKRSFEEIVNENQEVTNLLLDLVRARHEAVEAGRMDSELRVLPVIGNNDVYPHDQMESHDPMLSNLTQMWAPFLSKQALASFSQDGSYVEQVRPGVVVAVLNTIYLMGKNKETQTCDDQESLAAAQIRWLEKQLRAARQAEQRVLVAGHVPPSKGSYHKHCLRQYKRLAAEYKDVISGHIYGHTHDDQFKLLDDGSSPVGVVLIAPSLMPGFNPGVRVWHYNDEPSDLEKPLLLDYDQYYVDVVEANKHPDTLPQFVLEYTLSKAYSAVLGNGGVTPEAMARLEDKIATDDKTRAIYQRFRTVSSGIEKLASRPKGGALNEAPGQVNAFCACPMCVEPYEHLPVVKNEELWRSLCAVTDVPGILEILDYYTYYSDS